MKDDTGPRSIRTPGDQPRRFESEFTHDWLHLSLGAKLEIPRATKHNYHRWIFKVRVLFFGWELRRLNETRVSKIPSTVEEIR